MIKIFKKIYLIFKKDKKKNSWKEIKRGDIVILVKSHGLTLSIIQYNTPYLVDYVVETDLFSIYGEISTGFILKGAGKDTIFAAHIFEPFNEAHILKIVNSDD